jgi:hypothetical protein
MEPKAVKLSYAYDTHYVRVHGARGSQAILLCYVTHYVRVHGARGSQAILLCYVTHYVRVHGARRNQAKSLNMSELTELIAVNQYCAYYVTHYIRVPGARESQSILCLSHTLRQR